MKTLRLIHITCISILMIGSVQSCNKDEVLNPVIEEPKDPCKDVVCQNGGTCIDGSCKCPEGFVGEFCEYESGAFTDMRNNHIYRWVILKDGKKWMAENLSYWDNNLYGNSYYYNHYTAPRYSYGRMYTWGAIMQGAASNNNNPSGVRGICPDGWHVPSSAEWAALISLYGGHEENPDGMERAAYNALRVDGPSGLNLTYGGGASFDFWSGELEGFSGIDIYGCYWSSTEEKDNYAWRYCINNSTFRFAATSSLQYKPFNCRCIED